MTSKTEKLNDKPRAAHDKLQEAISEIVWGGEWKRMLKVAAKFHRYSLNNVLLIGLQTPDATLVAGYRRWQELGRQVRKGEKGLAILAPCRYRTKTENENGDEETTESIRGWRVVHVWDVSQTNGKPIEDLDALRPKLLDGDAPWDLGRAREPLCVNRIRGGARP